MLWRSVLALPLVVVLIPMCMADALGDALSQLPACGVRLCYSDSLPSGRPLRIELSETLTSEAAPVHPESSSGVGVPRRHQHHLLVYQPRSLQRGPGMHHHDLPTRRGDRWVVSSARPPRSCGRTNPVLSCCQLWPESSRPSAGSLTAPGRTTY